MLLPNQLTPLKWYSHITKSHFNWLYDPDNDTVYQQQSNQYMRKYIRMRYNNRIVYVGRQSTIVDTNTLHICNVQQFPPCTDSVLLQHHAELNNSNTYPLHRSPAAFHNFQDYLKYKMKDEQWIITHLTIIGDIENIMNELGRGTLRAVSDGSCDYDRNIGTSGWCIISQQAAIRGVNRVPHGSSNMDSMRSELGGLYTILTIIETIASYYDIRAGQIEIGSDCDTALDTTIMNDTRNPLNNIKGDHLDFINSMNITTRTSRITYKGRKIKGHQDTNNNITHLTWWEQRNVEMNDLAKSYMQQLRYTDDSIPVCSLKNEGVAIFIKGRKITHDIINTCHDAICTNKIDHHWHDSGRIPLHMTKAIDWSNMDKALKTISLKRNIWTNTSPGIALQVNK